MPEKGIEIRKLVGRNEKADWVCNGKNWDSEYYAQ